MRSFSEVVDLFSGVGTIEIGHKYTATCPVCSAEKHLYITLEGDKVLLYCQKCRAPWRDIAAAAGLSMSDLFLDGNPKQPAPAERKLIDKRTHIYTDADGNPVARKDIKKYPDGKKCYWQRYDRPTKKWETNLKGIFVPLYNLPAVLNEQKRVFVVEGEKDADTLAKWGLAATTLPNGGGATKWYPEYNEAFAGKGVVILTDNDDTGRNYGEMVAGNVSRVASQVKVVPCEDILPDLMQKGDITDIADRIGTENAQKAMMSAVEAAPTWKPSMFAEVAPASVPDVLEPVKQMRTMKQPLSVLNMEECLEDEGISIRFNDITHEVKSECSESFLELYGASGNDNLAVAVWDMLKPRYTGCTLAAVSAYLNLIARKHHFNPVLDKLQSITWDGISRKETFLQLLHIPANDTLSRTLIVKWLQQCVSLAMNTDDDCIGADGILVLNGAQGIGKTTVANILGAGFVKLGQTIDPKDKDLTRRSTSTWITEFGELEATINRADNARLKSFITQDIDRYRNPYDKSDSTIPRRTSFIATCNSEEFLIDQTGSRRFWVVPVEKIDLPELRAFDAWQLWSEIYDDVIKQGRNCFRLTNDERIALQDRNCRHQKKVPAQDEIEDFLAKYRLNQEDYIEKEITATQFRSYHYSLQRFSAQAIGRALSAAGYQPHRTKEGRFYKLPVHRCNPIESEIE